MKYEEVIAILRSKANKQNVEGMARFGINDHGTLGVSMPEVRKLARQIGKNHKLAVKLWQSGIHEAKILAALVENIAEVTEEQLESWVVDFDSWDVCDQVCSNLFDKTPWAYAKIREWSAREEEFVRRAGFVLIACLAVHDKKQDDKKFVAYFPLMVRYATDERNFVRKAVNWSLRQVGKRSGFLRGEAQKTANLILKTHPTSKSARWIALDAIRELR